MKINGKETAFEPQDSLAVILEKNGFSLTKIAVMPNATSNSPLLALK